MNKGLHKQNLLWRLCLRYGVAQMLHTEFLSYSYCRTSKFHFSSLVRPTASLHGHAIRCVVSNGSNTMSNITKTLFPFVLHQNQTRQCCEGHLRRGKPSGSQGLDAQVQLQGRLRTRSPVSTDNSSIVAKTSPFSPTRRCRKAASRPRGFPSIHVPEPEPVPELGVSYAIRIESGFPTWYDLKLVPT